MADAPSDNPFVFPRWANYLLPAAVVIVLGGGLYVVVALGLGGSAKTLNVGYAPEQPIAFSHKVHAGQLGMDCRYCHTTVEDASFAAIPSTDVCMNCHSLVKQDSPEILKLRESAQSGRPIEWIKVHNLPDYAYFNHAAHVNKGVSCVECHGRVDQMDIVQQVQPLSMSWCLECHREPELHLRPIEAVTNLAWKPTGKSQEQLGAELSEMLEIHGEMYMQSCSTCHR